MKALINVVPTSEQLPIISNPRDGVTLIRGAAGSGKTTTALLMLKQLSEFWLRYRARQEDPTPVRILVLTYNRTLLGYITHLAEQHVQSDTQIKVCITTFGRWATDMTGIQRIISDIQIEQKLISLGGNLNIPNDFLCDEVEYLLGRFTREDRNRYLITKRIGRGVSPRMERTMRESLINEVIIPYERYKQDYGLKDWNDLAVDMIANPRDEKYDIIVVDETQDFSANQIRTLMKHAGNPSNIVFVMDTAQRIYPRGWNWTEVGINVDSNRSFRLNENYRNTIEICKLAKPLLSGLDLDNDGSIPDLDSCKRHGPLPQILKGKYSLQCLHAISSIQSSINLSEESIAFAHPKAGGWFDYLRRQLITSGLDFVELTRRTDWPQGDENIALISMHSAKGLEFDHIFILGLNEETTPHGNEDGDSTWENLRRLLAMTITRARYTVTLGCKPEEASTLLDCLEQGTYEEILLNDHPRNSQKTWD